VVSAIRRAIELGTLRAFDVGQGKETPMSNFNVQFTAIEIESLTKVAGGAGEGSIEVATPGGFSGKASGKVAPNPVKQYGTSELLACKQQASDNFGGMFKSGERLDAQLADCDKQFGKQ
jgi:hypothetical protein